MKAVILTLLIQFILCTLKHICFYKELAFILLHKLMENVKLKKAVMVK